MSECQYEVVDPDPGPGLLTYRAQVLETRTLEGPESLRTGLVWGFPADRSTDRH